MSHEEGSAANTVAEHPHFLESATTRVLDVAVIGAGQAGLSAAYHLKKRGFVPLPHAGELDPAFLVLDAEPGPGGAWQHRWESLRMATVNGIAQLPGMPVPPIPAEASSREALPKYFGEYEDHFRLGVLRPVRVRAVSRHGAYLRLSCETSSAGAPQELLARYVINATGTWTRPFWPHYPGRERFTGRQLHVHDYVSAEEFAGQRVVIVGSGISATQLLEEISHVADTLWVTREAPRWEGRFTEASILASLAEVEERSSRGLPPTSIVRVTGMYRAPWVRAAEERGVLRRYPMFQRIEANSVLMPDGTLEPADAILWATGFRAELRHLAPLQLRTKQGGIRVQKGRSLDEPRLFVIGYGASQSTIGANRAGRDVVLAILADSNSHHPHTA